MDEQVVNNRLCRIESAFCNDSGHYSALNVKRRAEGDLHALNSRLRTAIRNSLANEGRYRAGSLICRTGSELTMRVRGAGVKFPA